MPHLQGAATNLRPQIQHMTLTGPTITGNDTTNDVWPIWVADSNTGAQNIIGAAIGMPHTAATLRAIQAAVDAQAHHAINQAMTSGNSQIWTVWTETYTSTSTTVIAPRIVNQTATNSQIWGSWNASYTSGTITIGAAVPARVLTEAEHIAAREARAAEDARWRERNAAVQAEEAKAKDRAEKLLQESLDGKQREELAAKGYFELDVISKNGSSRRYRIHRRWSHSIHQIDPSSGNRLKTLCIHPREQVPIADSMLAQKLMLESGMEEDLLRIANHS